MIDFKMFVEGVCNGVGSWTSRKTGVVGYNLMILVPGSSTCLAVGIPDNQVPNYKVGQDLKINIRPRFYNGMMQGLEMI